MEIGTSTVRLAEVNKRGKIVEILKTHVFDTPDDATKDGKVRVSDAVVSSIRDGLDESGIKSTDVYFVVESTKILFKQVELPLVQRSKIQSTLELSFTDIFPVDETLYHVSYVFEKAYEKNGQKMMALDVFAIPNDLSESYYNLAVALGLNAKGLTDTSRSMISLFPSSFKNRNIAMVNINESVSTLTISVGGDMVFNKTIPYGVGSAIRHVINSPLTMDDLDVTAASELMYTQNVLLRTLPEGIADPNDEEEKLRYNVTASIVSLVKSIEQTFAAFLSKESIQIQEFHLSGLGAGFAGISQLLTYEFGIPVTVIQQEGNLRINPLAADETLLLSCYPCVGAAIDQANFFTAEEKAGGEIAHKKKIDKMFIFVGALICLVAFGYGTYSWLQANLAYQDAQDENVLLENRVRELRDLGVEVAYNDYMTAVSYNKEVLALYDKTRSGNEDMTVFLAELENTLPVTARVMAMTISPTVAEVSLRCEDKFVAAGVLHLLRNMDTITNMECPGVAEIEQTGEIAFQCTFLLKTTADRLAEEEAANAEQENAESDVGEMGDGATDNGQVDPDSGDAEQSNPLLAETIGANTEADLATIMLDGTTFDIKAGVEEILARFELESDGTFSMASNGAVSFGGLKYFNADGVEISISESNEEIVMIKVDTDDFTFYNELCVGMTTDGALNAINDENIDVIDNFIILKNADNTLVLCIDSFDGTTIETIYLINNHHAYQSDVIDPGADDALVDEPNNTPAPENEEDE